MLNTSSLLQQHGASAADNPMNGLQAYHDAAYSYQPQAFLPNKQAGGDGATMMQNSSVAGAGGDQPLLHHHFSSAPYHHQQPVPAAAYLSQQQDVRPSASPQPTPPRQYPMAAPPLPHTPTTQHHPAAASPKSPQTPGAQNREQQRIRLLFEINVQLLQEVNRLQAAGLGGAISPQQAMQLRNEGRPDKMASDEYIQSLRRVQANLAYLMPKASSDPNNAPKQLAGPALMTPPLHMAELLPHYEQLKELFPGWSGVDPRPSQSSSSPNPNGMAGPAAQAQQA